MKRIVSIMLCLFLLLAVSPAALAAKKPKEKGFKAFIATDIHHSVVKSVPKVDGEYHYYDNLGLTPTLAPFLLDEFLKQAAKSDTDYVFLTGDLADISDRAQAKQVAKKLAVFEKTSGKKVFVINGNHDTDNTGTGGKNAVTYQAFKEIYARFGYNEALAVHKKSCSYTADLKNGYRLIAIDAVVRPGEGGGTIYPALEKWIRAQAAKAKKDGVHLVALMHHPLMNHFTMMSKLLPLFVISNSDEACRLFDECGIRFVFTGHFHQNDIAVYHGETDVYDIETTSLSCYPNAYRTAEFSSGKVKIRTIGIDKIDASNLPKGYTAAQRKQIKNDLPGYAYSCLQANSIQTVHNYLTAEKVSGMLGISDPTMIKALDELLAALSEGFDLPLYGKKNSIESYAKEAGLTLPKTKYKTMDDAVAAFIAAQLSGDENIDAASPLFRVLLVGVTAILRHEAAKKVSPLTDAGTVRALGKAANAALSKLGFNDSTQTLGKKISADALLDLVLPKLEPLLVGLSIDKEPADNNVTLR